MCFSVREGVKNALSRTLIGLVFKIFKKEALHINQKYLIKQIDIFDHRMHTYLQKTVIFYCMLFILQLYSSVTVNVIFFLLL